METNHFYIPAALNYLRAINPNFEQDLSLDPMEALITCRNALAILPKERQMPPTEKRQIIRIISSYQERVSRSK